MDISGWTEDQILQLPEHVFGRQHLTGREYWVQAGTIRFALEDDALPDKIVISSMTIWSASLATERMNIYLKLGDHVPVNLADIQAMESIFPEVKSESLLLYSVFELSGYCQIYTKMRHLVATSNLKIASGFYNLSAGLSVMGYLLNWYEVPTRIHSWHRLEEARDRW